MEGPGAEQSEQILQRQPLFGSVGACDQPARPMKLPGILMYCVHWGKSNCTRPVLMSVLDSFFGKCPREPARGDGRGREKKKRTPEKKRRPNVPTNLPGQSGLVGQGSVTQQSKFQDFQSVTAPFSSRERKPLQETESCERTSTRGGEHKCWTGLDWRRKKKQTESLS